MQQKWITICSMLSLSLPVQAAVSKTDASETAMTQTKISTSLDASSEEPFESRALLAMLEEADAAIVTDSNVTDSTAKNPMTDFKRLRQQFLSEGIEPLQQQNPSEQAANLDSIVRRLRSLDIRPAIKPKTVDDTQQVQTTKAPQEMPEPVMPEKAEPVVEETPVVEDDLLSRLEKRTTVTHPLRLADTLYRQNHWKQALKLYEQAFQTLTEEDVATRQWVMFQMANCSRSIDPDNAILLYNDLIQRYPNAKWSPVATSRKTILEWQQNSEIERIITKDVNEPNEE